MTEVNPRAVIGGNQPPDWAKIEVGRLTMEYDELGRSVAGLLEEANALPRRIEDDETKGFYTSLIKRFRDLTKRIDALHDAEKQPHYRRGQGVDQFFFGLFDRCARRSKTAKPGAVDVLSTRLTDYDTRKLREEQERRRREAEEQARIAREAAEREAKRLREAEEARLAAERARKPEIIETKTAIADEMAIEASAAKVEAEVALTRAESAYVDTLAKPADIMRTRAADGTLSTMASEAYAEIEDAALLDKDALWPFISNDAKEKALRAWAKVHGHNKQMAGARIGRRPKSVVR